jgi:hypothetical protein
MFYHAEPKLFFWLMHMFEFDWRSIEKIKKKSIWKISEKEKKVIPAR